MAPKAKKPNRQTQPDDDDDDDGEGGALFTDEQMAAVTSIVNAAVSGQLQRKLPNAIKSSLDGAMAPVLERLDAMRGGRADDDDAGDDDDDTDDAPPARGKNGKGKAARGGKPDPEVSTLRKQVAQLNEERKLEREQNRNRDRDGQLREHLTKAGVDPNRIRGAIAVLRESTKYDDKAGEWYYTTKRDGLDEDLDLGAGAAEWVKTDEGKSYLGTGGTADPGRRGAGMRTGGGVIGGGAGGGTGGGAGAARGDGKQAKVAAKQEAMGKLSQAIDSLAGGAVTLG